MEKFNTRTGKSIKNSGVALMFYAINLLLQFYSRKIFLEYLGEDILVLNTTAMNLLQFLNLAELGISTAVGFTLYAPIANKDKNTINEIITLQGKLYKRIALMIICGAVLLMAFFPLIFSKIMLPLWYAYASFGVLLFSSLLGYFYNYRQVILSASQQDYKIQFSFKTVHLIKLLVQIYVIKNSAHPYLAWLLLEASFAVLASLALTWMTKRTFPWLKSINSSFKELRRNYPEFTKKIKQLFVHKIGTFVLTQSSPIIIYAYTTLATVTYYGNYLLIITGVQQLMSAIFNSLTAGVGNLVVKSDSKKIWAVFDELFSIRFYISAVICFVIFQVASYFITAWIGVEYVMSNTTLLLMVVTLFINLTRYTVETFINAYGLYQDIYAPAIEAALNIGLSIFFGFLWGLNGILLGVVVSLIVIVLFWKPYFLFTRALCGYLKSYILIYLKHLFLFCVSCFICQYIIHLFVNLTANNWINVVYITIISCTLFGMILLLGLVISRCGIVRFKSRIIGLIK